MPSKRRPTPSRRPLCLLLAGVLCLQLTFAADHGRPVAPEPQIHLKSPLRPKSTPIPSTNPPIRDENSAKNAGQFLGAANDRTQNFPRNSSQILNSSKSLQSNRNVDSAFSSDLSLLLENNEVFSNLSQLLKSLSSSESSEIVLLDSVCCSVCSNSSGFFLNAHKLDLKDLDDDLNLRSTLPSLGHMVLILNGSSSSHLFSNTSSLNVTKLMASSGSSKISLSSKHILCSVINSTQNGSSSSSTHIHFENTSVYPKVFKVFLPVCALELDSSSRNKSFPSPVNQSSSFLGPLKSTGQFKENNIVQNLSSKDFPRENYLITFSNTSASSLARDETNIGSRKFQVDKSASSLHAPLLPHDAPTRRASSMPKMISHSNNKTNFPFENISARKPSEFRAGFQADSRQNASGKDNLNNNNSVMISNFFFRLYNFAKMSFVIPETRNMVANASVNIVDLRSREDTKTVSDSSEDFGNFTATKKTAVEKDHEKYNEEKNKTEDNRGKLPNTIMEFTSVPEMLVNAENKRHDSYLIEGVPETSNVSDSSVSGRSEESRKAFAVADGEAIKPKTDGTDSPKFLAALGEFLGIFEHVPVHEMNRRNENTVMTLKRNGVMNWKTDSTMGLNSNNTMNLRPKSMMNNRNESTLNLTANSTMNLRSNHTLGWKTNDTMNNTKSWENAFTRDEDSKNGKNGVSMMRDGRSSQTVSIKQIAAEVDEIDTKSPALFGVARQEDKVNKGCNTDPRHLKNDGLVSTPNELGDLGPLSTRTTKMNGELGIFSSDKVEIVDRFGLSSSGGGKMVDDIGLNSGGNAEIIGDVRPPLAEIMAIIDYVGPSSAENMTIIDDVGHSYAENTEIIDDVGHSNAENSEIIDDVRLPSAENMTIIDDVRHSYAANAKIISNVGLLSAENAEIIDDVGHSSAENTEIIGNAGLSSSEKTKSFYTFKLHPTGNTNTIDDIRIPFSGTTKITDDLVTSQTESSEMTKIDAETKIADGIRTYSPERIKRSETVKKTFDAEDNNSVNNRTRNTSFSAAFNDSASFDQSANNSGHSTSRASATDSTVKAVVLPDDNSMASFNNSSDAGNDEEEAEDGNLLKIQGEIIELRRKECREQHKDENVTENECPWTFDGWSCVDSTPGGAVALVPCPHFVLGFDATRFGERTCWENGTWFRHPDTGHGWTNYTKCVDLSTMQLHITVNWVYVVGYAVSLVALTISLAIFFCFKSLNCTRVKLHKNLFISFLLNNAAWLVWSAVLAGDPAVLRHNQPWCQALHLVLHALLVSSYFWMLCEGLYLHTLLVVPFAAEGRLLKAFLLLGWGLPLPFVGVYALLRGSDPSATVHCWTEETGYTYILSVPVVVSMLLNVLFLVNIVRVLVTKLRVAHNTPDHTATRKAVRATLILVPLLGLHYLLTPFRPPPGSSLEGVHLIMSAVASSFQGFAVSLLFCFCNGEVVGVLKKKWRQRRLMTSPQSYAAATFSYKASMADGVTQVTSFQGGGEEV